MKEIKGERVRDFLNGCCVGKSSLVDARAHKNRRLECNFNRQTKNRTPGQVHA